MATQHNAPLPEGLEAGTRKKLPDLNKMWQAAVDEFRKAAEEVTRLVAEADETAQNPVQKHVSGVCDLFSSTSFEKSLKTITPSGPFKS